MISPTTLDYFKRADAARQPGDWQFHPGYDRVPQREPRRRRARHRHKPTNYGDRARVFAG